MQKAIYFDMDGTLAGLFFVKGYKETLAAGDATPYEIAKPLFNVDEVKAEITRLKSLGYIIGIVSYYGADADAEMVEKTIKAKKDWLKNYFPYADESEIYITSPEYKKSDIVKIKNSILIDDSKKNREEWKNGLTIDGYFRRPFINELKKITI